MEPYLRILVCHLFPELMRLMGTAKTDERKAIIRDSLVNLDSPDRIHSHSKRVGCVAMATRHNNAFDTEKVSLLCKPVIFYRKYAVLMLCS